MTRWNRYYAYKCRYRACQEDCINRADSREAIRRECRDCAADRDAARQLPNDDLLPSLLWALDAARPASEGERAQVLGDRAAPTRDRPERATGSDPLRVDPEARAHSRSPRERETTPRGGGKPQWRLNDCGADASR